jgi:uncharacterized protein involved in exopolysaccharide biosynthesis
MKRIMRFLVRLYPSSWRKRYGAELYALLEDAPPSARDAFDVFWGALKMQMTTWNFGRITLACSVAGILVAVVMSFALPVHYVSQAVLIVTPAHGPTSTGENGLFVANLVRDVFSREDLASVIQEHNLYAPERASMPLNEVIDKMKRHIELQLMSPASPGNRNTQTIAVRFAYSDAHLAQQVNEELMSRFMEGTLNAPQLNSSWIFRVPAPPTLPLRPTAPNRTQFAAEGLLAGLLAGLTLAIVVTSRRNTPVGTA